MRKRDLKKELTGKAAKTISFDKLILDKLEKKAKDEYSSVSFIVNHFMRKIMFKDSKYCREMQKFHLQEAQRYNLMKEDALEKEIEC